MLLLPSPDVLWYQPLIGLTNHSVHPHERGHGADSEGAAAESEQINVIAGLVSLHGEKHKNRGCHFHEYSRLAKRRGIRSQRTGDVR